MIATAHDPLQPTLFLCNGCMVGKLLGAGTYAILLLILLAGWLCHQFQQGRFFFCRFPCLSCCPDLLFVPHFCTSCLVLKWLLFLNQCGDWFYTACVALFFYFVHSFPLLTCHLLCPG